MDRQNPVIPHMGIYQRMIIKTIQVRIQYRDESEYQHGDSHGIHERLDLLDVNH